MWFKIGLRWQHEIKLHYRSSRLDTRISGTEALNLKETIKVEGNGDLYARTNIPYAIDLAQGLGTQTYTRAFGYQSATSGSFESKYVLKGAHGNGSNLYSADMVNENRYLIGLVGPNEKLQYVASINGISDIYSDNSVELIDKEYDSYRVATRYDMGGQGILKEKITDSRDGLHPVILTEARANGLFNLTSEMDDKIQVPPQGIDYASSEYLSSRLPLYDKPKEDAQSTENLVYAGPSNVDNESFVDMTFRNSPFNMLQSNVMINTVFNRPVACYKPSPV